MVGEETVSHESMKLKDTSRHLLNVSNTLRSVELEANSKMKINWI